MTSFVRMTIAGLAALALASTLSIALGAAAPVHAAELRAPQGIADDPPGGETPAPSLPDDGATRTAPRGSDADEPSTTAGSCHDISNGGHECTRIWWPGGSPDPGESSTDSGTLTLRDSGGWTIFAACDFNGDGVSIGIQIDPTDGTSNYYTRRPATESCSGEVESRTINRFRFVAVDRTGTPVGTPTDWETPPWGAGPP
ncbi:hypothetical protein [Pseudonocardia adelaidensis]|uniref:hypothetical protein n=1 Tax=Pseudonocardia adelaidensis TaxID=648754 RepID=UPI0031ED1880